MSDSSWRDELSAKVPQLQIIVGALVAGCVFFGVIAVVMVNQGGEAVAAEQPIDVGQPPMITYISLLFGVTSLFAAWIVPSIMVGRARRAMLKGTWQPPQGQQVSALLGELFAKCGDAGRLWLIFVTHMIVRAAIIEGAAFFLLVAYLIEQSPVVLIAAIILVFLLAAQFPSRARSMHWIEDQLNTLEKQRQFGP